MDCSQDGASPIYDYSITGTSSTQNVDIDASFVVDSLATVRDPFDPVSRDPHLVDAYLNPNSHTPRSSTTWRESTPAQWVHHPLWNNSPSVAQIRQVWAEVVNTKAAPIADGTYDLSYATPRGRMMMNLHLLMNQFECPTAIVHSATRSSSAFTGESRAHTFRLTPRSATAVSFDSNGARGIEG